MNELIEQTKWGSMAKRLERSDLNGSGRVLTRIVRADHADVSDTHPHERHRALVDEFDAVGREEACARLADDVANHRSRDEGFARAGGEHEQDPANASRDESL